VSERGGGGRGAGAGERAPVAVVIVTWNAATWVADCLGSLRGLVRSPAEVVVVDNGSSDGTAAIVREGFPEAVLVECGGNVGFCRANNLGISRTRSPLVLVLNPDARLAPGFIEELLPAFDDPRIGIAAGKLLRPDGRTLDSAGQMLARSRQPLDRGYGEADEGRFDSDAEVFGACGAAALYRRSMLEEVADPGGEVFDERFFAFYEDLDLAWRARRLGWRAAYRHRAVGWHARGATASRESVRRRKMAFLHRSAEARFHIAKNRYLTILRNDTPGAYLRDLPFVLGRDLALGGMLLLTSPGVLLRLWRERTVFGGALEKRRLDSARPRHQTLLGGPSG
jgi:GT2 family glycosyltransferase